MNTKFKIPHINKTLIEISKAANIALLKHNQGSELNQNIVYNVKDGVLDISIPGYAIFVDEGTEPHMPPISVIEKWSKDKGLNAWAVANSIKRWGTKAQPFLYEIDEVFINSEDDIIESGLEDLIPLVDNIFEKSGGKVEN